VLSPWCKLFLIIIRNVYPNQLFFLICSSSRAKSAQFEIFNLFSNTTAYRQYSLASNTPSCISDNSFRSLFPRSPPLVSPFFLLFSRLILRSGIFLLKNAVFNATQVLKKSPQWVNGVKKWLNHRLFSVKVGCVLLEQVTID